MLAGSRLTEVYVADYSHLVVAEALGSSNKSQVVDLQLNSGSPYTPGYAIYENGTPTRVLLINFMDDNGVGNAQYTGYVHIGGVNGIADTTPSTVYVRYLNAPSVSEKFNITWAGQTVGGGQFMSDGRMEGTVNTVSITCSPTTGDVSLCFQNIWRNPLNKPLHVARVSHPSSSTRSGTGVHVNYGGGRVV